jgi:hypothetical protein
MSQWISQWFGVQPDWEIVMEPAFALGMLAVCILFILAAVLLWLKSLFFPSFEGVTFVADKGKLVITPVALQSFVGTIVARFKEVTLRRVRASRRGGSLCLRVEVDASPEASLAAVSEMMRSQILDACASRLGISEDVLVDLVVVGVETEADENGSGNEMVW